MRHAQGKKARIPASTTAIVHVAAGNASETRHHQPLPRVAISWEFDHRDWLRPATAATAVLPDKSSPDIPTSTSNKDKSGSGKNTVNISNINYNHDTIDKPPGPDKAPRSPENASGQSTVLRRDRGAEELRLIGERRAMAEVENSEPVAKRFGGEKGRQRVDDLGNGEGMVSDGGEVGGVGVVLVDSGVGWETGAGLSKDGSTAAPVAPTAGSMTRPSMPEAAASTPTETPALQKCEAGGGAEEKAGRIFESRTGRSEDPAAKADSSIGGDEVTGIDCLLEDGRFDGHGNGDLGSAERNRFPCSSLRLERERGRSHVTDDERDTGSGFNGDSMPTLSKPGRHEEHPGTGDGRAGGQPKRPVSEAQRGDGGDGGKARTGSSQHVAGGTPAPTADDAGRSAPFQRVGGDNMESREGSPSTMYNGEADSASAITGGDSSGEERNASVGKESASANGGNSTDGRHDSVNITQGGRRSTQPRLDEGLCDPRNRQRGNVDDSAEQHVSEERSIASSVKTSVDTSVTHAGHESRAADGGRNGDGEDRKSTGDRGTGEGGEGGGGKSFDGPRPEGERQAAITDAENEYGSDFASEVRPISCIAE